MVREEKRGVVVYVAPQGETNRVIGLYTEDGMIYFTLYGAKSARKHIKSACSLLTMGRFTFNVSTTGVYKFVDIQIFDNGISLSRNIELYYAACAGAELVKLMVGAEHKVQFKTLVDFLLLLIKGDNNTQDNNAIDDNTIWKYGLVVFLWQSLLHNGWLPEVPHTLSQHTYIRYISTKGLVSVSKQEEEYMSDAIEYSIIHTLLAHDDDHFNRIVSILMSLKINNISNVIAMLFKIWHAMLGFKLALFDFVIH